MKILTCAAANCTGTFPFNPVNPGKKFHTPQCAARTRMALKRARDRQKGGGDDGGGNRQRKLFPRPLLAKAKPPKAAPVPAPTLFGRDLYPKKIAWRESRQVRAIKLA
jgi:hypothetical protein